MYNRPMTQPTLRIRRTNQAVSLPSYAKPGDAALDLQAAIPEPITIQPMHSATMGTGLAFAIPSGYFGLAMPRSSMAKRGLMLANTVGVIDSGYRGEVLMVIRNISPEPQTIQPLERLCQMAIIPVAHAQIEEVETLDETARGQTGFGSSGTH